MLHRNIFFLLLFVILLPLAGCSTVQEPPPTKGFYKVGKPYEINGIRYYPKEDYDYSETGIASWYGPNFNGKKTANGEQFYQNELTAAHRTLPMPSIIRVTNLDNGKSVILRVNDRGPYAKSRIIDISERGAELLGYKNHGTAKVRVEVLEAESKQVAQAAKQGIDTRGMEIAMNNNKGNYKPQSISAVQTASGDPGAANNETNIDQIARNQTSKPVLTTTTRETIPGHMRGGAFYPDPIVAENAIKETQIYVQAGSFSSYENALALANQLKSIGDANVAPAYISGRQYYRVRFAANNVSTADSLLNKVIRSGQKNALIVVE